MAAPVLCHHDLNGGNILVTAVFGVAGEAERERLAVHELLLAIAERTWVVIDRPQGWASTAARLDTLLEDRTS